MKILKRVIIWLYFSEEDYEVKIVKILGFNNFLVDCRCGQRMTVSPVWDIKRVEYLFKRLIGKTKQPQKEYITENKALGVYFVDEIVRCSNGVKLNTSAVDNSNSITSGTIL